MVLFIIGFLVYNFTIAINASQTNLLFIDTANYDQYNYNTFVTLAQAVGFSVDFRNWFEIKQNFVDQYRTIIIALDHTFYSAIAHDNIDKNKPTPVALQHIYAILHAISKLKNKVILFLLPAVESKEAALFTQRLLDRINVIDQKNQSILRPVLNKFLQQLFVSDVRKSYRYHTALVPKKDESLFDRAWYNLTSYFQPKTHEKYQNDKLIAALLPLDVSSIPYELEPLLPLTVYLYNNQSHNHYFVSSLNAWSSADIKEYFIRNPINNELRDAQLRPLAQVMNQLFAVATADSLNKTKTHIQVPKELQYSYELTIKQSMGPERNPIVCAWIDFEPYLENKKAISSLFDIPIHILWIQLNPEFYFSKRAYRAEQKEHFVKQLSEFNDLLKQTAHKLQKPIPKLYIGVGLTGNLGVNPPAITVKDMYGHEYSKIPSPFDYEEFWKPELLDVLDQFIPLWNSDPNHLPFAGLCIDFEMYHAQDQTGQFMSSMDFSDIAWNIFAQKKPDQKFTELKTVDERVSYLLKHSLFKEYLATLKNNLCSIAQSVYTDLHSKYPYLQFAAYNITLPYNLFYNGLLAGLSNQENPLVLATFNNSFYNHHAWLTENNIFLYHLPVLLLSKLKRETDFEIVKPLLQYHDGIWLNKISRLAQSQNRKHWGWDWGLETTQLDKKVLMRELSKYLVLTS